MTIKQQWKTFVETINYNILLKKKFKKLFKTIEKSEKKLELGEKLLKKTEEKTGYYLGVIKHLKNPYKTLKLYLESKQIMKKNIFDYFNLLFFKFDGYILYCNKAENFKIFKVKNLKNLYIANNKKEAYNIHEKVGTFKGKPMLFIKYPFAISLNVKDEGKLYYDTESYYNYVNIATKGNMTNIKDNFDFTQFIKTNLILIIVIGVLAYMFLTPEGKALLQSIMNGF